MSEEVFTFFNTAASSGSDFVRLQDGDKRSLRILSKPIIGFEVFIDNMPHRWKDDQPVPTHLNLGDEKPRKFAAFVVYEYDTKEGGEGRIKVWQFGQKAVIKQMEMLFVSEHWSAYELVITRTGKAMDTTYNITGISRPPEDNLLSFAMQCDEFVNLEKMFEGESPFLKELPGISVEQPKKKEKKPTDGLPF